MFGLVPTPSLAKDAPLGREIYNSFQKGELNKWDDLVADDVRIYTPGLWGGQGREHLKVWGNEFIQALSPRIDLIDEYESIDQHGNGRGFITINLNWKHVKPFFGIKPTGREGTSIETFIFTFENGKITRFSVADNTLELAIYLWERGFPQAHGVHPEPIVQGIERRN
ncbi:MAG: ester cyclase [Sphaerospermopsis sp. SIO1G2]|nr:ester cyclase [Sphaerospermopsis sp. SIO1G2]